MDKDRRYSWIAQCVMTVIAIIDITIESSLGLYPWPAAFIRPLILISQFK